uniref:Uncharacterized protein n=1 Tax=Siphoviridae sp. ctTnV63 TaxID=2825523 RepID=A0A8S5NXC1_9CAUD|nr:MAG TPA: hypothetical protein [Siphoviridae sp. ctTnV63]
MSVRASYLHYCSILLLFETFLSFGILYKIFLKIRHFFVQFFINFLLTFFNCMI